MDPKNTVFQSTEQINEQRNPKAINYRDTISSAKKTLEPQVMEGWEKEPLTCLLCSHTPELEHCCQGSWV